MIALRPGQPEGALLQDRVAAVPQGQAKTQPLLNVAEPGQPVLAPAVGARPGLVVRQAVPCVAAGTVVFPDRAPLPLADVRPPAVPVTRLAEAVLQPAKPATRSLSAPIAVPVRSSQQACAGSADLVLWPIGVPTKTRGRFRTPS